MPDLPALIERVKKLTPDQRAALSALGSARCAYWEGYLSFRAIAKRSGIPVTSVRRTVRRLAKKGLAEYGSGLFTEDGEVAGSGYCITPAGLALLQAIDAEVRT